MPSSGGEKKVRVLSQMVGVTAASVGGGADRGGRDQMRALDKGLRKTSLPINRLETNFWPLRVLLLAVRISEHRGRHLS